MNVQLSRRALMALMEAPQQIQKAFIKQMNFLCRDLKHPGLHTKKYDETNNLWQARINGDWRFWFEVHEEFYFVIDLGPHPK